MAESQQQQQQQPSSQNHPFALRPGGPSPSSTPQPQPQKAQNSIYDLVSDDMPSYQNPRTPSGPGLNNTNGTPTFSPPQPQSPTLQQPQSYGQGSSRFPSQLYQFPQNESGPSSSGPYTDGPRNVQPLFAQHSGGAGAQSSRPVSRGAPNMIPSMPTGGSSASGPSTRPTSAANPNTARSPFSTPITSPPRQRPHQILLINPNSTRSMTEACLTSIRPVLPPGIEVTGYTAPYPAPTAIESTTDAIMSTEAVLRDLAKHAASNGETVQNFDGMIVACFSKHPLIDALRESYDVPVIGIMEASLYVARMIGGRFGIVATAARSKIFQDDAVAAYGLSHFYVGSESTHLGVLELETRPREEVAKRMGHAARSLAVKGADTILLGCAGMTELTRAAKDAVRDEDGRRTVNVIDSVEAGIMMMASLVDMGIPTSKKGVYKGEKEGRRTRGQNWL
ncbi:hypothetical protein LTR10_018531 [Elasticomyces elasticus]|uniref:Asp/Glu/hydantoin racemase n=1 Tax=Exophiala sideris TaxID=1016849 RepID=A0ABR0JNE7_9EURO|nr:hypothetical protein LTR10_018531 [Elasticomyces elasticus]KAK5038013.1 hypothetical protein LTS07_001480 [Exophiala sideris]KAK5043995.1 hypothetical protein LTR13_000350 [Exophiala sideris]KAK5067494.1 hypothetical protein LTR69_001482 [Exophiala sideris]KAK5184268.1 hypothetical protein LTR44_003775 [Eurotiomycetes sp. CCFEE 6388]